MDRLSVVDEIFLRTHRGLGTPIALQGLWRTADLVDPALLARLHALLSAGPLGRRVIRPRVPGARRAWQPTVRAHPLDYPNSPIPVAALLDWADAQGSSLDPEFDPGWRLSAVPLDDGGTVVALTCSHALADGRGLVHAADAALTAIASADSAVPAARFSPASDWSDAWRQWSIVLRGTARALRKGVPERPRPGIAAPLGKAHPDSAILQFSAREWDRLAAEHGGTANSLFIWSTAQLLWADGFPREVIEASLPVDTRDEPRTDNDLAMTSIAVTRSDDPATLREKAKAAYEYRMSSPGGMPEELLQVIPDRWAHALAAGAGERDILCSNIGTLPGSVRTLGPNRCTGVAARAIHPGLQHLPRTRLSGYLCRIGDDYLLSLVSPDPATPLAELIDALPLRIPMSRWS